MWAAERVEVEDHLRQGDLVLEVVFPKLQLPVDNQLFGQQRITTVPVTVGPGIVISHCCDNERDQGVTIAPVKDMTGNLSEDQVAALMAEEPSWEGGRLGGYDLEHLYIEPIAGILEPRPGKRLAANLNRPAPFVGRARTLRERRIARMTVPARRLLRIKLGYLASRAEEGDIEELRRLGLPPGPTRPPE